jgi:hypothetical protein
LIRRGRTRGTQWPDILNRRRQPGPAKNLPRLAEPIGMSDYEVIRTAFEVGRHGLTGMSFLCIPPGSAVMYRVIAACRCAAMPATR